MKRSLRVFVVTTLLLLVNLCFFAGATTLGTDPTSIERAKKDKAAAEKMRETKEGKKELKKAPDTLEKKPEGYKEAGEAKPNLTKTGGTSKDPPADYLFMLMNGRQIAGRAYRTDGRMIYIILTSGGELSLPRNVVIGITEAGAISPTTPSDTNKTSVEKENKSPRDPGRKLSPHEIMQRVTPDRKAR